MEDKRGFSFRFVTGIVVLTILVSGLSGGAVGFFAGIFSTRVAATSHSPWLKGLLSVTGQPYQLASGNQVVSVSEESATVAAVKKVSPAVVSIVVTKDYSKIYGSQNDQNGQFPFNDFFGFNFPFGFIQPQLPQGKQEVGGGTGFVIDAGKGLILTNRHVVDDDQAEYSVVLNNGDKRDARILARDPVNDLAVLQIDTQDLSQVELGNSDDLDIGETVIAIGNALGEYRNTVTRGVVSAIGRTIVAGSNSGSERLEGTIQTDAAINPGNSGGPLVNLAGQVVGINTAIDQQGQSVGFAIPVNAAKQVVESVITYGKIVRPYLGVRYVLINEKIAKDNNLDVTDGALVVRGDNRTDLAVVPGSPADKAGIVENDIILAVDGQQIDEAHSLAQLVQKYQPGQTVKLKLLHKGDSKEVDVTLSEYKE